MPFAMDPDIEKFSTKYEIEYVPAANVIRRELTEQEKQVLCGVVLRVLRNLVEKDSIEELIPVLDGEGEIQESVAEEIVNHFESKVGL